MATPTNVKFPDDESFDDENDFVPYLEHIRHTVIGTLASQEDHESDLAQYHAQLNDFFRQGRHFDPAMIATFPNIKDCLEDILDGGQHISEGEMNEAFRLLEQYDVEARDYDPDHESSAASILAASRRISTGEDGGDWCYPDATDEIWGLQGELHGLAARKSKGNKWMTVLDPRYVQDQVNALRHGHSHLAFQPGKIFYNQMQLYFVGGHGETQANFAFHNDKSMVGNDGIYSLILAADSDSFWDFNEDEGEVIWYSGDYAQREANDKPQPVSVVRTTALQKSLEKNPIRIFRQLGCSEHFPIPPGEKKSSLKGLLRYDGLYEITGRQTNNKNVRVTEKRLKSRYPEPEDGMQIDAGRQPSPEYERFDKKVNRDCIQYCLKRLPDGRNKNVSLDDCKQHPNAEELERFKKARKREFIKR
ncbi:hypothetical protein AC578_6878 [Pseudocercospora eumusae]|uniref:YDG domain-containing protein n=1 Tax=Pseudocercospora eumusae TaxID=321146 RepID=A0A139H9V1_9PEZI|nr:hypothetical protein AC578_6878 [Pseudocercospora eumusae]